MNAVTTIQDLAAQVRKQFVYKTRTSTQEQFWARESDADDWIQSLCLDAHGDMMPDDHKYAMICESLDALSEFSDEDEARDSLEAPIYTSDLTSWLNSHNGRIYYVEDAITENGWPDGDNNPLIVALSWGYLAECREVFDSVLASLTAHLEESTN